MEEVGKAEFYVPGSNAKWVFFDIKNPDLPHDEPKSPEVEGRSLFGLIGLWDHSNMNSNMKKLLDELHINEKSTKELLKTLKHETGFINPTSNIRVETQGENSKDTLIDSAKAIRIIYEWDVLKTRPSIVCRKYDENQTLVRKIFYLFNQKQKLIKIHNRRFFK